MLHYLVLSEYQNKKKKNSKSMRVQLQLFSFAPPQMSMMPRTASSLVDSATKERDRSIYGDLTDPTSFCISFFP